MKMVFEGVARRDIKAQWGLEGSDNFNTIEDILWEVEGKRVRITIEEVGNE
ncbi:MAG: hypothetical protein LLG02_07325 [Pelosinus sp.]|nr:hypothetical protein [Pelosinus sp.]